MRDRSDDDIIAHLNANDTAAARMAITGLGLVALLVLFFAGAFFTGHAALLENQTVQIVIAVAVGGGFLFAFFRMARSFSPAIDPNEPEIVRKRIDAHHRSWRWVIVSSLFSSIGCVTGFAAAASKASLVDRPYVLLFGGLTVFLLLLYAWMIASGPGGFDDRLRQILNDEFVCALRARTTRLGYAVMMTTCAVALLTGIWRPDLALPALAWALYAGFAVPALYYVIADWRAGRSEGA